MERRVTVQRRRERPCRTSMKNSLGDAKKTKAVLVFFKPAFMRQVEDGVLQRQRSHLPFLCPYHCLHLHVTTVFIRRIQGYPRYSRFRKIVPTNWYLVPLNVVPWHRLSGCRNSKLGLCNHVSLKTTCVESLLCIARVYCKIASAKE